MDFDETGKRQLGWKQNSMISINKGTGQVTYNPEFYLIKHFSHFVRPKSHKLKTSGNFENILAFQNEDGSIIVVTANMDETDQVLKIEFENQIFSPVLKAKSFNTFRVKL